MFGEVLEQIVDADRLGYDVYAAIEHFFFTSSRSLRPRCLFRGCRAASGADPFSDDAARASVLEPAGPGLDDRRRGHPHGWPLRVRGRPWSRLASREAGVPLGDTRARGVRRRSTPLRSSHERTVLPRRRYFPVLRSHIIPFPTRDFRVTLEDFGPDLQARGRGRVGRHRPPRCCPTSRSRSSRPLSGEVRQAQDYPGHRLDPRGTISTRTVAALREAQDWTVRFIKGNCSPLTCTRSPRPRGCSKRIWLLHRRDHGAAERDPVRAAHRGGLHLGQHAGRHHRAHRADARECQASAKSRSRSTPAEAGTGWRSRTRGSSPHRVAPHFQRASPGRSRQQRPPDRLKPGGRVHDVRVD